VFACYIVFDVQLMIGGGAYSIEPDEYVFAAINIYLVSRGALVSACVFGVWGLGFDFRNGVASLARHVTAQHVLTASDTGKHTCCLSAVGCDNRCLRLQCLRIQFHRAQLHTLAFCAAQHSTAPGPRSGQDTAAQHAGFEPPYGEGMSHSFVAHIACRCSCCPAGHCEPVPVPLEAAARDSGEQLSSSSSSRSGGGSGGVPVALQGIMKERGEKGGEN
jgi:hypothetical protein